MKKTIWIPLALGGVLGLLSFISSAVGFLIPLGFSGVETGPQEIPLLISAGLSGPLGIFVAALIHELGIYLFIFKSMFSPDQMSSTEVLFAAADLAAHILALLAAAYCYRFLHQRAKKVSALLAGWILIVALYYTLLVFLQSFLGGLVIPDIPPFSTFIQDFMPEFQVVLIITTLILLALPKRFRRQLWFESMKAPEQNG
jgi:hypothetical protein